MSATEAAYSRAAMAACHQVSGAFLLAERAQSRWSRQRSPTTTTADAENARKVTCWNAALRLPTLACLQMDAAASPRRGAAFEVDVTKWFASAPAFAPGAYDGDALRGRALRHASERAGCAPAPRQEPVVLRREGAEHVDERDATRALAGISTVPLRLRGRGAARSAQLLWK